MDNPVCRVYAVPMRTQKDRLRHSILFELIGLLTCTPIASWLLGKDLHKIGVMTIFLSVTAMACNYVYNLAFDHILKKLGRPVHHRPPRLRAIHAFLFESSFIAVTVPFVAWWLGMSVWAAFVTNIGFAGFYLVYAYVYNWSYDRIFPMPVDDGIQA